MTAAAEMFEARGYLGTSLQDIVTGRQVSKGALYFHFPSKEDLALAILTEQHQLWPTLISELREHQPRAIHLLLEVFWRAAGILRDNALARAGTRLACEHALIGASAPPLFSGWTDIVEQLLREARQQGDLRPDADTRVVAEFLVASFTGLQRMSALKAPDSDLHEHLAVMWRHLLPGLVKPERVATVMTDFPALDQPPPAASSSC
ncbi:ScbR family autoregulator-binding transcription factor [Actinomadura alba]